MFGFAAICETSFAEAAGEAPAVVQTTTVRYATHSFTTAATDVLANTNIPGRLVGGVTISRTITQDNAVSGAFGPLIVASYGELTFANPDGALDEIAEVWFADGREVRIKTGYLYAQSGVSRPVAEPFDNFVTRYHTLGGTFELDRDTLRLTMRDRGISLQRQLQLSVYAGTGGAAGTADMAGRTKPLAFGRVRNATAQQVDPANLIYQIHDGPIRDTGGFFKVYDAGVALVSTGSNYSTYAALAAASVTAAQYSTSWPTGCFKLGTIPYGAVTCDVDGDFTGSNWAQDHGTIILRILERFSDLLAAEIDYTAFAEYAATYADQIGLFLPAGDQSAIETVISSLALSGGAILGQDRSGLYRIARLAPPTATPVAVFTTRELFNVSRERLPYGVPWRSWDVDYQRNWTVQTGAELAINPTVVTEARRRFLEASSRHEYATATGVALTHPSSAVAQRFGYYETQAGAAAEAARLTTLYSLGRKLYRFTVKDSLFTLAIGQTVRIVYDRWGLQGGRNLVVVSVTDDATARMTEILGFG